MQELNDALEYANCTVCGREFEKKHLYMDYDMHGKLKGRLCSNCRAVIDRCFAIMGHLETYLENRERDART